MPNHHLAEIMQEKHLSIFVFGLEVAASDGYDELVHLVLYMTNHGGSLGHAFDIVRHDSNMLEIPTKLHVPNQINPTFSANFIYLEEPRHCPSHHIGPKIDSVGHRPRC